MYQNHPEGLLQHKSLASNLEFLGEYVWGESLKICLINRYPGDVDVVSLGTTFSEIINLKRRKSSTSMKM
jgi:hypothetical protein